MHVNTFTFHGVHVNPKTNWTFIRVELSDGSVGWGECSLNGWESLQQSFVETFRAQIEGKPVSHAREAAALCKTFLHSPGGLIAHSIKSATEQALIDALARSQSISISNFLRQELGARDERRAIEVYANINRGTQQRTLEGFAASARRAVAAGFKSIKLAPFDGVLPSNGEREETKTLIDEGIARTYAAREAVGANVGVKVDCHWRFTPRVARDVLDRLRDANLDWFECPVSEHVSFHDEIRALRKQANAMNVKLAGAEMFTNVDGFKTIIEGGLYDTIMPDVKYCGGLVALYDISVLAAKHGVQAAPHNPTGPICNFASLHACAIGAGSDLLEYQLGESELYERMVFGAHPEMNDGAFVVPSTSGLGATVDETLLAHYPWQPVIDGLHLSLG
jgi:galactonate dehydratase